SLGACPANRRRILHPPGGARSVSDPHRLPVRRRKCPHCIAVTAEHHGDVGPVQRPEPRPGAAAQGGAVRVCFGRGRAEEERGERRHLGSRDTAGGASGAGKETYFLFSILLNLSRDAYEIRQLMEREATGRRSSKGTGTGTGTGTRTGPGCVSEQRSHAGLQRLQELRLRLQVELRLLLRVLRGNPPLLLDLLKNLCDLCIPLERLRLRRCGAAVLGLCGVTASLLSIVTILQPWLRLKP
uniref:Peroxisomal biosis factor 11 beta n=1 Tax=Coturnix japonica TaxID=93934 RepID=A0A8C2TTC3_COTJA